MLTKIRAYGSVYRCLHKETGFELAVKVATLKSEIRASLQKEIEVLKKCKDVSITSYYGCVEQNDEFWVGILRFNLV